MHWGPVCKSQAGPQPQGVLPYYTFGTHVGYVWMDSVLWGCGPAYDLQTGTQSLKRRISRESGTSLPCGVLLTL